MPPELEPLEIKQINSPRTRPAIPTEGAPRGVQEDGSDALPAKSARTTPAPIDDRKVQLRPPDFYYTYVQYYLFGPAYESSRAVMRC